MKAKEIKTSVSGSDLRQENRGILILGCLNRNRESFFSVFIRDVEHKNRWNMELCRHYFFLIFLGLIDTKLSVFGRDVEHKNGGIFCVWCIAGSGDFPTNVVEFPAESNGFPVVAWWWLRVGRQWCMVEKGGGGLKVTRNMPPPTNTSLSLLHIFHVY